ncbi:hypothetical protein Tco_0874903 [Tanacetum coccineum]|uniref:Uncharacterized protein n=1 Tax=Tanacetum coccineum TaxID=301880 RepID=A0ABQ5BQX9_9ASTR
MVSLNEQADTSFAVEDKGFLCGEIETCSSIMSKVAAADDLLNLRFQKVVDFASTLFHFQNFGAHETIWSHEQVEKFDQWQGTSSYHSSLVDISGFQVKAVRQ